MGKILTGKQNIALMLSVIFMSTGMFIKFRNYTMDIKDIFSQKNIGEIQKQNDINIIKNKKEVEHKILDLSKTLDQAISCIHIYITNEKFSQAINLIEDCNDALDSIEQAITNSHKEKVKGIGENTKILRAYFFDLKICIEKNQKEKSLNILEKQLIPWYKTFLKQLNFR